MFRAIKNYTIVREIGSGAMATVYEAVDKRLRRTVALKVFNSDLCKGPTVSERFISEATAAAKINHPNVVRIFDFGAIDEMLYIVMEYIPGTNMERVLKVRGAVRPLIALEIMYQIADALSQAHYLGIIHGDIKPGNILLHKEGRAMLSDFNLTHLSDPHLSTSDAVAATHSFKSPEQINGKAATAVSDIYSWGVCFYTLITGKLPYRTQTSPEIMEEIRRGAVDLDPVLMGSLQPQFYGLLSLCLEIDPPKRTGNASELLRQFEHLKIERPAGVDLRSFCGDISDEYDAPRTSPSATGLKRREKRAPFSIGTAVGVTSIVIILALCGLYAIRLFHRTSGPQKRESVVAASIQKSAPMQTQQHEARVDSLSSSTDTEMSAESNTKPVDQIDQKQASEQPVSDSMQAILDSFKVLSPEWTGTGGYAPKEELLNITATEPAKEDTNTVADKDSGDLVVDSDPVAKVYVDGREIGKTPFSDPLPLAVGVHVIKLKNDSCETMFDSVIITADSILLKQYRLEAKQ